MVSFLIRCTFPAASASATQASGDQSFNQQQTEDVTRPHYFFCTSSTTCQTLFRALPHFRWFPATYLRYWLCQFRSFLIRCFDSLILCACWQWRTYVSASWTSLQRKRITAKDTGEFIRPSRKQHRLQPACVFFSNMIWLHWQSVRDRHNTLPRQCLSIDSLHFM